MNLSSFFKGIAYKRLVAVDLPNKGSHQHELNGSRKLVPILGDTKLKGQIKWTRFSDAKGVTSQEGDFTWYDAREKSSNRTGRSEWRFYYRGGFLSQARLGDSLVIAKLETGQILGLLFEDPSKWLSEITQLLGTPGKHGTAFEIIDTSYLEHRAVPAGGSAVLEALGLPISALQISDEPPSQHAQRAARRSLAPRPEDTYKIRPAGRHILTIGRDLIQDQYAAIVELVKNAYDADSPDVVVKFKASPRRDTYSICIEDHGHGMSRDDVIGKWMVPSTNDKVERRKSPDGRIMQGRKGVGRYAAAILGDDLLLETVQAGEKTSAYVEWKQFESAEFLDDVEILIETEPSAQAAGTRLTITGRGQALKEWDQARFDKLRFELKKLVPPVAFALAAEQEATQFRITLISEDFLPHGQKEATRENIEPYPIFELADYKIAGTVTAAGKATLTYSLQKVRNAPEQRIEIDFAPTGCGELVFDVRVYDREREAIDSLIRRGLRDESGGYMGNLEARQLLNDNNGIGVYRNGFRLRPLGDADFDWLKLNEQRVQNPSLRIGSNQVIGYVLIQSEEQSGLIEKSARDGLRENGAFQRLKRITQEVIGELEKRRFDYRQKAGLSRPVLKVERELERLFAFDDLKEGIRAKLKKGGLDKRATDEIIDIISKEEAVKNRLADDIRQAVAIYQGQATLGKIINVILHEGRRPLNYFKNQIPNLNYWYDLYCKTGEAENLKSFLPIAEGVEHNAQFFVDLFSRLDPLAAGKRAAKKKVPLKKTIEGAFSIFRKTLEANDISSVVNGSSDFQFPCWTQDVYAIFTNLVDNSIYWITEKRVRKREISVTIKAEGDSLQYIDYRDTGPGIEPGLIISGVIFEPEFSTKPGGTGLGLAIAGESATRNGLELKAFESASGAYFRLQPKAEN